MTELLFYNDKIQVANRTMLHRTLIERGVCRLSHLSHDHESVLSLDEFKRKCLNADFLTYNGCVQTVKYIKSLDVDVQSKKFSNLRKSLIVIC